MSKDSGDQFPKDSLVIIGGAASTTLPLKLRELSARLSSLREKYVVVDFTIDRQCDLTDEEPCELDFIFSTGGFAPADPVEPPTQSVDVSIRSQTCQSLTCLLDASAENVPLRIAELMDQLPTGARIEDACESPWIEPGPANWRITPYFFVA